MAALCLLAISALQLQAVTLVVHQPYLQNMAEDHVTIVWSTRDNVSGEVQFSTDQSFSRTAPIARVRLFPTSVTQMLQPFVQYQADLTGLTPATQYYYRIIMAGGQNITPDPAPQFHTAGPGPFRFLVIGDSGLNTAGQQDIALLMNGEKPQPDLVLHVGDIAYENGTFDEFTSNYFAYYASLMRRVPWFAVPGNHEYQTSRAAPFIALQANPTDTVPFQDRGRYFSFDWGDVHFIGLDSDLLDVGQSSAAMLDWLENDLQASAGARWRIAYFHHLPYPISHHLDDPVCKASRNIFVPILERHNVQLVLAGHEHNYQRSFPMRGGAVVPSGRGTTYITSGGGGGVLHPIADPKPPFLAFQRSDYEYLRVEVDANTITVHAIDRSNKEFDHTTLFQPSISGPEAVVNAASFDGAVAPGTFISIFGQGFAAAPASVYPFPTSLGGTSVTANGTLLPLTYVSPGQINALLPFDLQGPANLRVVTASGAAETSLTISDTAPAIFSNGIWHNNGPPVSAAAPARPGDALVVYMTGLGVVDATVPLGQPSPGIPLVNVLAPVQVNIGDLVVKPLFSGLTPGSVGLYQVNLLVPPDLPAKVYPLRILAKGTLSNVMNVQVQGRIP